MEVEPKRTLVIMQGTGEDLCQGLTKLFSHPTSTPTYLYFWAQEPRDGQKH